jgi:hypothetical protein
VRERPAHLRSSGFTLTHKRLPDGRAKIRILSAVDRARACVLVKGFWSLTLYDAGHFFHPNALNRFSLGTKNRTLKSNADGSLTFFMRVLNRPARTRRATGCPRPRGRSRDICGATGLSHPCSTERGRRPLSNEWKPLA